jgi:hypothetical protein
MWSVGVLDATSQQQSYPGSIAFMYFATQADNHCLDVRKLDVARSRLCKYGLKCFCVLAVYDCNFSDFLKNG